MAGKSSSGDLGWLFLAGLALLALSGRSGPTPGPAPAPPQPDPLPGPRPSPQPSPSPLEPRSTSMSDWELLVVADPGCPVGQAVLADPARFTGLEPEYAHAWTADQGFTPLANMRAVFSEAQLAVWMDSFLERFNAARPPELHLHVLGGEGEPFDPSVMRKVDSGTIGSAVVTEVVRRDGIKQHGFGVFGSAPLLYAVVRAEQSWIPTSEEPL